MRLPNFLLIGAAKSGTTTLYEYLCRHPQIYMCTPKEPDFFSIDKIYAQGVEWYSALFEDAEPDQVCGDASTTYSRLQQHPQAAARIAQTLPNVKLVYIMRNPVDRAYSFYVHRLKVCRYRPEFAVPPTFEEAIKEVSEFVDSGNYIAQIEEYLQYYSKESFLFLLMEDLVKKPEDTMTKIFDFLGVDSSLKVTQSGLVAANPGGKQPEWIFSKELTQPIKAIPGFSLAANLLPKWLRHQIYEGLKALRYESWSKQQYLPPPMLPETRQMLLNHFRVPNQKLANFLNRDLSAWSK